MTAILVTDADREAVLVLTCGKLARTLYAAEIAEAIARARAEEREACLRAVEDIDVDAHPQLCDAHTLWGTCSDAIRARGEQGGK